MSECFYYCFFYPSMCYGQSSLYHLVYLSLHLLYCKRIRCQNIPVHSRCFPPPPSCTLPAKPLSPHRFTLDLIKKKKELHTERGKGKNWKGRARRESRKEGESVLYLKMMTGSEKDKGVKKSMKRGRDCA